MLVNTGATVSLAHCGLLTRADKVRCADTECGTLSITTVMGEKAVMRTKKTVHVSVGKHTYQPEIFVGDIQEPYIGLDLLERWRAIVDVADRELRNLAPRYCAGDELFERSSVGLDNGQKLFLEIFAADERDCTHTDLMQHHIDTGDTPSIHFRPRHLPLAKRAVVESKLRRMLKAGCS